MITPTTTGGTFNDFLWQDGSSNNQYTIQGAEEVYVTATSMLGCVSSDTMLIDTLALPPTMVLNDTQVCDTVNLHLPELRSPCSTQWTFDGSIVDSTSNAGLYIQTVESVDGCIASDSFHLITIDCDTLTGLITLSGERTFEVFPNPANAQAALAFDDSRERTVKIYNSAGVEVIAVTTRKRLLNLSVQSLARGMYLIQVSDQKKTSWDRLILN